MAPVVNRILAPSIASIIILLGSIGVIDGFAVSSKQNSAISLFATATSEKSSMPITKEYSPSELKEALESLTEGSEDPYYDSRHIFGNLDPNHELSMLQTITATRILDYNDWMANPSAPSEESLLEQAKEFANEHGPVLDLQKVIRDEAPRMALAAEFKRASPSKGDIAPGLNAGEQAVKYASAGANIISVLTEPRWFKGSLDDMEETRLQTLQARPAILRKDFVVNEYMIAEAAARGADTVLLIVAVLPQNVLEQLIGYARKLGMEPLVEIHADSELDVALEAGARVIGVNNRNLHTFMMDMSTTQRFANKLTRQDLAYQHGDANASYTLCALSGMSTAMDVDGYRQSGVAMCLIGESLMRAADPAKAIANLCLNPNDMPSSVDGGGAYTGGTKLVKVCGITNAEDALVACRAGANLIGVIFAPKSKRCVTVEQAQDVVRAVWEFGERDYPVMLANAGGIEPVPRLASIARSLQEAASKRPVVVGVFQNQSASYIKSVVRDCGLDMVQLHGEEGMEAANVVYTGAPTIRVVNVETDAGHATVEMLLDELTMDPAAILLDTSIKGVGGGTGVTFDWSIAERIQEAGLPVLIAGGLRPENVQDAVSTVRPWGVDVSSGVEASPGKKDHQKVRDFVQKAHKTANSNSN